MFYAAYDKEGLKLLSVEFVETGKNWWVETEQNELATVTVPNEK